MWGDGTFKYHKAQIEIEQNVNAIKKQQQWLGKATYYLKRVRDNEFKNQKLDYIFFLFWVWIVCELNECGAGNFVSSF